MFAPEDQHHVSPLCAPGILKSVFDVVEAMERVCEIERENDYVFSDVAMLDEF